MDEKERYMMATAELPEGWVNMALGEPVFLQQCMAHCYPEGVNLPLTSGLKYQRAAGIDEIREMCPRAPGVDGHVVMANGAKQALAAAMYGLRKCYGATYATAAAPHWPSFPTLAEHAGLTWTTQGTGPKVVEIITTPNNPNGMQGPKPRCPDTLKIWDAAYASGAYDWRGEPPAGTEVTVCSAAKWFGMSGVRVGWLVTPNETLAGFAEQYVEASTSGVSTVAQLYFAMFMDRCRWLASIGAPGLYSGHRLAAATLLDNGTTFASHIAKHLDQMEGAPAGKGGMFAWVRPKDPEKFRAALKAAQVMAIPGYAFSQESGVPQYGDWWRLNVGISPTEIEPACARLAQELS